MIKKIIALGIIIFALPTIPMQKPQSEQYLSKKIKPHNGRVTTASFIDDNRILSGSFDGTVKITDKNSGQSSVTIPNLGQVVGAGIMDNKTIIAVASNKNTAPQFYFAANGQFKDAGNPHQSPITALTILSDIGIATGAQNGSIWAIYKTGLGVSFNVRQPVTALTKTSNTQFLALTNTSLSWLDTSTQRALWHNAQINGGTSVAAVGSNRWAIGLNNGTITILDSSTGSNLMRTLSGHNQAVYALSAFQDPYLVSGSGDGSIKIWDASTGKELINLNSNSGPIFSVATHYNQQNGLIKIVAGTGDGSIVFYDLNINNLKQEIVEPLEAR